MDLTTVSGLASGACEAVQDSLATLLGSCESTVSYKAAKLWQAILRHFVGNAAAMQSIEELKQQPEGQRDTAAFRAQLESVLAKDTAFQQELRKLLHTTSKGTS